jgi:predicted HD superfamily hydrolase involved in NAD metabolism
MDYELLFDKLKFKYRNFRKLDHLEGVSETAYKLANIFVPKKSWKARIAGFLHDVARYYSKDQMFSKLREESYKLTLEEKRFPILLHGKVAAIIAKNELNIKDKEILYAIANHVTGSCNMPMLSKIVFVSDVIEPNRNFDGIDELRETAFSNINLGFKKVLKNKLLWLLKNEHHISIKTINLWNKIMNEEEFN